jgi:hypothetical protein
MTAASLKRVFDEHQADRPQELIDLANLLDQQGLTPDSEPIRRAASQCQGDIRFDNNGRSYWGFEIADLQITLEDQRHLRPRLAVMDDCRGVLSVKVEEYVLQEEGDIDDDFGILRETSGDFHFDAYHEVTGEMLLLRAAWHLDTHNYSNASDHSVHPRFHFQLGGDRLARSTQIFGAC